MATNKFVCIDDYEKGAKKLLPEDAWDYINCGADGELTVKENVEAFQRIKLRPRIFRDVRHRDMSTTLLGEPIALPVCVAPSAVHKLVWHDGEVSTARACQEMQTCYVTSLASSSTLEEITSATPTSLKWQQMYVMRDRAMMVKVIREVERQKYKALVITVDHAVYARRRKPLRGGYLTPPVPYAILNELTNIQEVGPYDLLDPNFTLKELRWLKSITSLPIVVKGVLTPEDAVLAAQNGVSAVWVSNHGGRMLDPVPATIDVLQDIVSAVGDKVEVYVDSGVRTGADVLKALALGARAVFVGRPVIWGLACQGQAGVEGVLGLLKEELDIAMALSGCTTLSEINPSYTIRDNGRTFASKL